MKKTLNNREKEKLSRIMEIDDQMIQKLSEHDILNTSACRAIIIRDDYRRILSEGRHSGGHIVSALANDYGLSRATIEMIIYNKTPNKKCTCIRCGNSVTQYKFTRYGGLCDTCLVREVKID